MNRLFAGLDVSTQSCKLVVIDQDEKNIEFVTSVNYDEDLPAYKTRNGVIQGLQEGVSESDPQMWIDAVNIVFRALADSDVRQCDIKCIAVSGQQHGLVSLDDQGLLTRTRSKLWNDFSTLEECKLLTDALGGQGAMIDEVGNSQRTGYTAAKIHHMRRHEPEAYEKTALFFLVHNYINWYLTGGVSVMEPGDTSGMALWNPVTGAWSRKVIDAIDPGLMKRLPSVTPSDKSIGHISGAIAKEFGFSESCVIDAGSGDNMYGAVGTGNVVPGIVTISLGTSGTAYSFMEQPYIDPKGEIASFCDSTGHYLPLLCVSNLANGYNQLLKQYDLSHEAFNQVIHSTPAGNHGRMIIPWYEGERTPDVAQAAPLYFGFRLDEFTRENLCRGVLEGHVLNLYDGFQRMPLNVREIRLTGGLSNSDAWCQCIADIFEAETIPVEGEGAALGAALHAAWVWLNENGDPSDIEEVVEPFITLNEKRRKIPSASNLAVYRKQKELFNALSARVRGLAAADPFELRAKLG
ncbi:MAG: FGGY family carbohydrate kinase [candidate division KSB1 bacterium]|nr:FGGY family carbohydrate kinase [candidate division KSB1 bacterium]